MFNSKKCLEIKKDYLKTLYKKYEALYKQLATTLNQGDKPAIEESIKSVEAEIKNLEAEIKQEETKIKKADQLNEYRMFYNEWQEKLPEIDFKQSKAIIENYTKRLKSHQSEEVIFLIQKSTSMAGHLLVRDIKSKIQLGAIGKWSSPCEFGVLKHEQANKNNFLTNLAKKFAVEHIAENSQTYTNEIINKIIASLRIGSILFFDISIYSLTDGNDFIEWFLGFWNELVDKVQEQRKNYPHIKLVAVISVGNLLPKSYLKKSWLCDKKEFDGKKITELPLKKWLESDICNWLKMHSGIDEYRGLKLLEIEEMSKQIFDNTENGNPNMVCNELMEALSSK